jgi:hypothetical protein
VNLAYEDSFGPTVFGEAFGVRALRTAAPSVSVIIKLTWHERTEHAPAMRAFRELVAHSVRSSRAAPTAKRRRI